MKTIIKSSIAIWAISAIMLLISCGGGGSQKKGEDITLSAQLSSGTVSLNPLMEPLSAAISPLNGYALHCITVSNNPVGAKSQPSGAKGNVSLTLGAKDIPLVCFINDSAGSVVAAMKFTTSTNSSQAAKLI